MTADTSNPVAAVDAENVKLDGWRAFWAKWHEDNFRAPDPRREPELWQLARLGAFGYAPPAGADFIAAHGDTFDPYTNALVVLDTDGEAVCISDPRGFDALRSFSMVWTYATRDAGFPHLALAAALIGAKSPGLNGEGADRARRALAQELADRCRALASRIGWDWPGLSKLPRLEGWPPDLAGPSGVVDIGGLDIGASLDAAADFLEGIGPEGRKAAKVARKFDPAALWADPAGPKIAPDAPTRSPLMWALASVLWADVVGPKLDREAVVRVRQSNAALFAPIYEQLGRSFLPARLDAGRSIVSTGEQLPLPLVVVSAVPDLPVEVLGKVTAQLFVRWVIRAAAAADFAQVYTPVPGANGVTVTRLEGAGVEVVITGGYQRLTEVIGAKPGRAEEELKDALSVLSGVHLREMFGSLRHGSGGTLIHRPDEVGGRGGGVRKLTFIVHPILCSGAVKAYGRSLAPGDSILTLVLPFPSIPLGFEKGRTPAALGRFDWEAARYVSRHRRPALANGGLVIDWNALAKGSEVTPKARDAALELWFAPGPTQRWEGEPGGLCMYASNGEPDAAAARAFILEGAGKAEAWALKGAKGRALPRAKAGKTRGRSPT